MGIIRAIRATAVRLWTNDTIFATAAVLMIVLGVMGWGITLLDITRHVRVHIDEHQILEMESTLAMMQMVAGAISIGLLVVVVAFLRLRRLTRSR